MLCYIRARSVHIAKISAVFLYSGFSLYFFTADSILRVNRTLLNQTLHSPFSLITFTLHSCEACRRMTEEELLTDEEEEAIIGACTHILHLFDDNVPHHDSYLTGSMYNNELMASRSEARFLDVARMTKEIFLALVQLLEDAGGLKGGRRIGPGEKLMILIHICQLRFVKLHSAACIKFGGNPSPVLSLKSTVGEHTEVHSLNKDGNEQ